MEENIGNKLNDCFLLEGGLMKEDKAEEGSLDQNLELLRKEHTLNVVSLDTLKKIVQIRGFYLRSRPTTTTTPKANKICRRRVISQTMRMIVSLSQRKTITFIVSGCLI
jgi:hypothetical protein